MLRRINQIPVKYHGSEYESIAGTIRVGFTIFPFVLSVSFIRQLLEGEYLIAGIFALAIAFAFAIRWVFLLGHLKTSVITVSVFFTTLLTVVCSLGNGVHDIGLIGFPIIIGFSSIILDPKPLIVASVLCLVGLSWLVIGDKLGLFSPNPAPVGSSGDFLISALMVSIGGFVAYSLTFNMKGSLQNANDEIKTSKQEAQLLAEQIEQKEEIIEEIHRAVINSLNQIQNLIDYSPNQKEQNQNVYESIKRKTLVIETAHEILLQNQAPILLSINELTQKILDRYKSKLQIKTIRSRLSTSSQIVSLDQAIHFGILFLELIHELDKSDPNELEISLSSEDDDITLKMSGYSNIQIQPSVIVDLLTKQLKAALDQSDSQLLLTFKSRLKK